MNPILADMLLNNLLANAIRHNIVAGNIEVETANNYIAIRNRSESSLLDEKIIFDRFHKASHSDGLGIGLAIVKQICELYGFRLEYAFKKQMHDFQVSFR